jgi:hypothetical protein
MVENGQNSHEVRLCEQAAFSTVTIHFLTKNCVADSRIIVAQQSFSGEKFSQDTMNPQSQTCQNLEIKLEVNNLMRWD